MVQNRCQYLQKPTMLIQLLKCSALSFLVFASTFSCSDNPVRSDKIASSNFYYQPNVNRMAAEWEPAVGTMIVWPLCIPYKLAVELAKDSHIYTLVENEQSKIEALKWYTEWGIDSNRNTFIYLPLGVDSWWVRDWGPPAVFTPDGTMKLGDGRYVFSTPISKIQCGDSLEFLNASGDHQIINTQTDDRATGFLSKSLNIDLLDLPFINTGGNVLTDGLGTAFSTCILVNENRFFGVSKEKFFRLNKELLGIERYNILSNFEKWGMQHIDCYMKLLDEERILVMEPPKDHELFQVYEDIIENEIKKLKNPYGRPYEIFRIKTERYDEDRLAAYTNSLIVNKTIYVPLFNIKEDSVALSTWRQVMPGYAIKGFGFKLSDEPVISQKMRDNYQQYGWRFADALHCRVRAIWDAQMLFMTSNRIEAKVDRKNDNTVYVTIIDYSKKGLQMEDIALLWRVQGEEKWNSTALNQVKNSNHFYTRIPFHTPGATVQYYLSAVSKSGRKETLPKTAPAGYYQFSIQ